MASDNSVDAPVYRYFTADLMSNEILMEIPFSNVTWERALKAGGSFSGEIPVIPATNHLDLYNTTMPGQTGLYVMRDGVCVWGGIIWSRSYNVKNNTLDVSGSEFTSYFHHRNIWKTMNYQFSSTISVSGGKLYGVLDTDKTSGLSSGSSVKLEFYEPDNFRYNGYYKILGSPPPTEDTFATLSQATANFIKGSYTQDALLLETDGPHGFREGDTIAVDFVGADSAVRDSFNGTYQAISPFGPESTLVIVLLRTSIVPTITSDQTQALLDAPRFDTSGTIVRGIPDGEYYQVTTTVRTDTYDYIRGLVSNVFEDFVGLDFANDYLTPGIENEYSVTRTSLGQGFATITTGSAHGLAVGQSVRVRDVSPIYNGEFEVVETPSSNVFMYSRPGSRYVENLSPRVSSIVARSTGNYTATMWTAAPHKYVVGDTVTVEPGDNSDGLATLVAGTYTITNVPSTTSFSYDIMSKTVSPKTTLANPVVNMMTSDENIDFSQSVVSRSLLGNTVTLRTQGPHTFGTGDKISVSGVNISVPISERAIDGPNNRLTIRTKEPHQQQVGDTVVLSGIKDYAVPSRVEITGASGLIVSRRNVVSNPYAQTITTQGMYNNTAGTLQGVAREGTVLTYSDAFSTGSYYFSGMRVQSYPVSPTNGLLPSTEYVFSAEVRGNNGIGASLWASGATILHRPTAAEYESSKTDYTSQYLTLKTPASGTVVIAVTHGPAPLASGTNRQLRYRNAQLEVAGSSGEPTSFIPPSGTSGMYTYTTETHRGETAAVETTSGLPNALVTFTTTTAHNFVAGSTAIISGVEDTYVPADRQIQAFKATINTTTAHNMAVGDSVRIENVYDQSQLTYREVSNGIATLTASTEHPFSVNDQITVSGVTERVRVISKEIQKGIVTLTFNTNHNIQVSQEIVVSGVGAPFNSIAGQSTIVLSTSSSRLSYQLIDKNGNDLPNVDAKPTKATGWVDSETSVFNGNFVVTARPTATTLQIGIDARDISRTSMNAVLRGESAVNGTHTILSVPNIYSFTFATSYRDLPLRLIPGPLNSTEPGPTVSAPSVLNGEYTMGFVSRYTVSFRKAVRAAIPPKPVTTGGIHNESHYRGLRTVTAVPNPYTLTFGVLESVSSLETSESNSAYVYNSNLFNGNFTISSVDQKAGIIRYRLSRSHSAIKEALIGGRGTSTVTPVVRAGTFGSFPGNSDIDIQFSTRKYSGKNLPPIAYRGHELTNVGSALDSYSGTIDGFEYRIDCAYDEENDRFTRTFVLIPIDFPNPPPPGQASPPSRFGADRLVFEYPGNISDVKMEESAENSATRFFAVGKSGLGGEAADPFSAASAEDLLNAKNDRKWPILDQTESMGDISDETVLYGYAKQFLSEARPPEAQFTVTVNGSLQPEVPNYYPGDWCSLIVNDPFLKERLASSMEPRDSVIVRKIDSFKVKVPDGTTFPETVSLNLVAEWDIDRRDDSA